MIHQFSTIFAPIAEQQLTEQYGEKIPTVYKGFEWLLGEYRIPGCLNRAEYREKDEYKTLVAKPDQLTESDLQELLDIAKSKDMRVIVTAPSNFNAYSLLVIITQLGDAHEHRTSNG
jgi:hypothetical protein